MRDFILNIICIILLFLNFSVVGLQVFYDKYWWKIFGNDYYFTDIILIISSVFILFAIVPIINATIGYIICAKRNK